MSQTEKTPGQVLWETSGITRPPWDELPQKVRDGYEKRAAAIIAHHEAGRALTDRVAESVAQDVQAMRYEIDRLAGELETARAALTEQLEARRVTAAEGGALQQANTEIDALRAQLAERRVAVPEKPFPVLDLHGDPLRGISEIMWHRGWDACASRVRAIDPATEVVVSRKEWKAMCALGFDPEPCRIDHHGYCQEHNWFQLGKCPTGILQEMHALREGRA